MDQPPHPISKQNVDLLWFDDCGNLTEAKAGVHDRLPSAVSAGLLVGGAGRSSSAAACKFGAALERTELATLRAADA